MKKQDDFNFNGFEPANTTPVPDVLFDELLSYLTGAELKVLLYIIRRTRGFKKETDAISLTQFQKGITTRDGKQLDKGCGIDDRQTIINALASLEKKNCIVSEKGKTPIGDNAVTVYRICFKQVVVGNSNHLVGNADQGSRENPTTVVDFSDQGSREKHTTVVGNSNPQETVLQDTDKQQTEIQEESEGEQSDTTASAPSLSLDASPSSSPQSENHSHITDSNIPLEGDTHAHPLPLVQPPSRSDRDSIAASSGYPQMDSECRPDVPDVPLVVNASENGEVRTRALAGPQGDTDDGQRGEIDALVDSHSLPDANPARSMPDRGWQAMGEVPGGKEQEGQVDDPEATVPRMAAVTPSKQTPSLPPAVEPGRSGGPTPVAPAPASPEQNRDASPGNVAVDHGLGAASSVPIPPVPPEVSPPRTMRATVVSPNLPAVRPKAARRKKGELDEVTQKRVESIIAYLDALKQEVMEDPEIHYKPSKPDIEAIVNTLLPQNPTEKRVRLVFFDMWNQTDRSGEHFWRKHMKIHNVCNEYESRVMGLLGKDKRDNREQPPPPIIHTLPERETPLVIWNPAKEQRERRAL